jgi:hypothetical protein
MTKVTTQKQLDAALADPAVSQIYIESPAGGWLEVGATAGKYVSASGSATVRAYDSATVRAYGSATVRAYDSATVHAYDSATVHAYDSATVRAYGSATVHAYDSATVHAYDSATVRASGSATVHAYDSATVHAYDSATVRAYDSATVHAYDSATVRAYGSATVRAYGSATVSASGSATVSAYGSATVHAYDSATVSAYDSAAVHAGGTVAVHLHSKRVAVSGGVVIDVTSIDKHTSSSWCEWQGVEVEDGTAIVYKAVTDELKSGQGFAYPIGETVIDPHWAPTDACGAGLHFGPSPAHAERYHDEATRFLACRIRLDEAVGISGSAGDTAKIKARSCDVLYEVDIHGRALAATS